MQKQSIVYGLNIMLTLVVLFILFFVANISLDTQEHHEQVIAEDRFSYFARTLFANTIVSSISLFIIWVASIILINILKLNSIKIVKLIILEFIIFQLMSAIFIFIGM